MAALPSLRLPLSGLAVVSLLCALPSAFGVVVAGPDQTPTTIAPSTTPAFPWENMGFIGNSSAIFIGDVADNNTFWVLSAAHNGPAGSFTFDGVTYGVLSSTLLSNPIGVSGTPDLRLFQIDMTSLPSGLITLNLPTSLTGPATQLYMLGVGDENGIRDKRRWGYNNATVIDDSLSRVFEINNAGYNSLSFGMFTNLTNFTSPMEGYGVSGDSGGGVFYQGEGGAWYLAGIMTNIAIDGDDGEFRYTYAVELSAYADQILGIAAIPEPGTLMLIGLGAAGLLATRRRYA